MPSSSKITTRDVAPKIKAEISRPLETLAVIGVCEWGPVNQSTVSVDFEDWTRTFGSYLKDYHTALQVRQAFLNGVRRVRTVRVVALDSNLQNPKSAKKSSVTLNTASSAAATSGSVTGSAVLPVALVNGDTLKVAVDGGVAATATFSGTAATATGSNSEPFALNDGDQLRIRVDGGAEQTVTFRTADFASISAATAEEVVAVLNRDVSGITASGATAVTITSNTKGTSSELLITGGPAATTLGFGSTSAGGTGNVPDLASVSVSDAKTVIEAAVSGCTVSDDGTGRLKITSNTTGTSSSIQVDATSTADDEFGFDNATHSGLAAGARATLKVLGLYYGTRGDNFSVKVEAASSGVSSEFDLKVYENGSLAETFVNLTMDSSADRYVEKIVNNGGSNLIAVEDLDDPGSVSDRRPDNLASPSSLSGGSDGLTGLSDTDFVGSSTYGTGIHAFDQDSDISMLIAPDRATTSFANSVVSWISSTKRDTLTWIPDVPAGLSYGAAQAHADSLTRSSQSWGLYWPRIKIPNPDKSVYGSAKELVVAVSGSAAGRKAKNTFQDPRGPFVNPMNEVWGVLANVTGVENEDVNRESIRDKITPSLINPVRSGKTSTGAFAVWLDDAQVLNSGSSVNWKTIGEAAGVSQIRADIIAYLESVRGQPMTEASRQTDKDNIETYLDQWVSRGVFVSKDASEAYYVNTDPEGVGINNPTEQEKENYHVSVGLGTARAGRFIDLSFSRFVGGILVSTTTAGK